MRSTQKPEQHLNLVEFGLVTSSVIFTPSRSQSGTIWQMVPLVAPVQVVGELSMM